MRLAAPIAVARAWIRRRWPELAGLGLVAGLAAGVVTGLVAGAERTESAFDRLVDATGAHFDFAVTVVEAGLVQEVLSLPGIAHREVAWTAIGQVSDPRHPDRPNQYVSVLSSPRTPPDRHVLVRGRPLDPARANEIAVLEGWAEELGLDVGATFHWHALSRQEFLAFSEGAPRATGSPALDLEIVAVVRTPRGVADTRGMGVFGTSAFYDLLDKDELAYGVVQLGAAPGGDAALQRELAALAARSASPATGFSALEVTAVEGPFGVVRAGLRTQARGLLVAAIVLAVAAAVAVGQAVDRRVARDDDDDRVLAALGVVRSGRVLARVLPFAVTAVATLVVSLTVAIASSVFTPVGSARRSEPDPGLLVDWTAVGAGSVVAAVFVVVVGIASARLRVVHGSRVSVPARSAVADRVAAVGAPAPLAVGVRFALEPGQGRTKVPARSTLAGVTFAVAGVVAAGTVAINLTRLLDTPARYGYAGDLQVLNVTPEAVDKILADQRAAEVTLQRSAGARVGGQDVVAVAHELLRGDLRPTLLAGRHPRNGELAIGPELADALDVDVGDVVPVVRDDGATVLRFQVVGIAITTNSDAPTRAAVFTADDLAVVQSREPFLEVLIETAEDLDGGERQDYAAELASELEVDDARYPPAVRALQELRSLPPAVTVALMLMGAAAVVNGVSSAVRRRRRDLAVLRTLGFVRRRIVATVLAAAATGAVVGLVIGLPVGLGFGAAVWSRIAASVFVATDVALPWKVLAAVVPATLLLALLAAAVPARRASRLRPAEILHTE